MNAANSFSQLVARVAMRYASRELQPGDLFHASPVDARYLVRNKRAEVYVAPATPAPAPPVPPEHVQAAQRLAQGTQRAGRRTPTQPPATPTQPRTVQAAHQGAVGADPVPTHDRTPESGTTASPGTATADAGSDAGADQ
jgi:hypothetical protein